ncbi:uncharacterized protein STEHIDRAFT_161249 [Stereum hirsutum FP-91666 SS1]|uniref:uncharacterized protein n=1 Tax=Stereum hirsutum (strain FP-91666) TaxID=721885 RepID=UPI000444A467|nr:uncharacterized protein STEHIDRAFT_161249 [Stereum hirsutum FP-91666 SS1]EIM81893.1 hypothetical protein STEHIDRAFT_161249 [Stereum hirsutum FP-91666 SS1]
MAIALLALRVYAMYGQSRALLAVFSTFILGRLAIAIWLDLLLRGASTKNSLHEAFSACVCGIAINSSHDHELTLAGVVFDTLVLGLTMIKTYDHAKEMQRLGQLSVTQVLLRDGVMYYTIAVMITIVNATLEVVSLTSEELSISTSAFSGLVIPFFTVLPNLLINHLVLNLRLFGYKKIPTAPRLSEPAFARNRVLGNIGAPLDFGQWESINDGAGEHGGLSECEDHDVEGGLVSADNAAEVGQPEETGVSEVHRKKDLDKIQTASV